MPCVICPGLIKPGNDARHSLLTYLFYGHIRPTHPAASLRAFPSVLASVYPAPCSLYNCRACKNRNNQNGSNSYCKPRQRRCRFFRQNRFSRCRRPEPRLCRLCRPQSCHSGRRRHEGRRRILRALRRFRGCRRSLGGRFRHPDRR